MRNSVEKIAFDMRPTHFNKIRVKNKLIMLIA